MNLSKVGAPLYKGPPPWLGMCRSMCEKNRIDCKSTLTIVRIHTSQGRKGQAQNRTHLSNMGTEGHL